MTKQKIFPGNRQKPPFPENGAETLEERAELWYDHIVIRGSPAGPDAPPSRRRDPMRKIRRTRK
jgi:hypothetical protein